MAGRTNHKPKGRRSAPTGLEGKNGIKKTDAPTIRDVQLMIGPGPNEVQLEVTWKIEKSLIVQLLWSTRPHHSSSQPCSQSLSPLAVAVMSQSPLVAVVQLRSKLEVTWEYLAHGWVTLVLVGLELRRLLRLPVLSSACPRIFCRSVKFGWMVSRPHLSCV
jgi:hypothetical protein